MWLNQLKKAGWSTHVTGTFKAEPHKLGAAVAAVAVPWVEIFSHTTLGLPENMILMVENIMFIEMAI